MSYCYCSRRTVLLHSVGSGTRPLLWQITYSSVSALHRSPTTCLCSNLAISHWALLTINWIESISYCLYQYLLPPPHHSHVNTSSELPVDNVADKVQRERLNIGAVFLAILSTFYTTAFLQLIDKNKYTYNNSILVTLDVPSCGVTLNSGVTLKILVKSFRKYDTLLVKMLWNTFIPVNALRTYKVFKKSVWNCVDA